MDEGIIVRSMNAYDGKHESRLHKRTSMYWGIVVTAVENLACNARTSGWELVFRKQMRLLPQRGT